MRKKGMPRLKFKSNPDCRMAVALVDDRIIHNDVMEEAMIAWQFGDWHKLSEYDGEAIVSSMERGLIYGLSAIGKIHDNLDYHIARALIAKALAAGISRKSLIKMLLSSINDSLGNYHLINNDDSSASRNFGEAINMAWPGQNSKCLLQARKTHQNQLIEKRIKLAKYQIEKMGIDVNIIDLVQNCLSGDDIHENVDEILDSELINNDDKIRFLISLAKTLDEKKDRLSCVHYLKNSIAFAENASQSVKIELISKLAIYGCHDEYAQLILSTVLCAAEVSEEDKNKIFEQYQIQIGEAWLTSQVEHGHAVMISYLKNNLSDVEIRERKPVMVEIGTTRENVSGQGSTKRLAIFCKDHGIEFITVDMDPQNSKNARALFSEMGVEYQAITMKGEDFLDQYDGEIDFIFLDAYDFDHGKHSSLRQSRYQKYLGQSITDASCHKMHLDCAVMLKDKLSKDGLICLDDTWMENGKWVAKGATAMPYLLDHGFRLIEARNRSALLCRNF